jgi:3-methyladenine DNA glycosylase AlkD
VTVKEVLAELEALGDEKVRAINARSGAGPKQFGVMMGDIRALAKKLKTDHELALSLWKTGQWEARLLATLLLKPDNLSAGELDRMVHSIPDHKHAYSHLADWLMSYVVKVHPHKEELRKKWMADKRPSAARAGWSLTAERVAREPKGLDLGKLLDRIEREMASAPPLVQWTMNACLAAIGISHVEHRKRAVAIGEKLGVYRDFPTSKGCTSPFAPIWIGEMVRRQG